jgi:hypothetical protein
MTRTGSTVAITYDGIDITSHVLFQSCSFELQMSGVAGSFEITLKDTVQSIGPFVTGKEVTFTIDGHRMFGGYVMQVARKFAFPVDRTDAAHGGVASVASRQWVLRGVDYNILFDKRVLRFSTDMSGRGFMKQLPHFWNDEDIGVLVRRLCADYIDIGSIDYTTYVDDIDTPVPHSWYPDGTAPHTKGAWAQQGTQWRQQMDEFTQFNGGIYYIDPEKRLHVHAIESMEARWGFSDVPNHLPVTDDPAIKDPDTFQGSTYGFRDLDATEDGSMIINDALIWGGSEWAGPNGGTLFARRQNEESIDTHNRWQLSEVHFGEYGVQSAVDSRAEVIVNGTKSGRENQQYGFRNPQWQLKFSWFGHDVPFLNGARDHLRPGNLVTTVLYSFGSDLQHPLIQTLPLRTVRVSFPGLDANGNGYVSMEGYFGIQMSDPWTIWRYLLQTKTKASKLSVVSVSNLSESAVRGGIGNFSPMEQPDGERTWFTIFITVDGVETSVGYIPGTTSVYLNGSLLRSGTDYEEAGPEWGEIRFATAPQASDWIKIQCRTMSS